MVAAGSTLLPTSPTTAAAPPGPAKQVRSTLGNGLGRLLAQSEQPSLKRSGGLTVDQNALTIRDAEGRVLVHLTPQANVDRAAFRAQAEKLGLVVENVDAQHGTMEGFAPLSAVASLSALKDTGTLAQVIRPEARAGKATSQGVVQQRVDKVQAKGVDGKGITIAALSDTYDQATSLVPPEPVKTHAKDDVKSGDLPGKGNAKYPQPVVVVEDLPGDGATDEGRAMLQIAHDLAPASKLCFATAFTGEIGFADNIRKVADKKGPCRADVVVDDIVYLTEPMFSDGPIADAVDEVAKKGTHYFSAAGNNGAQQAWESKVALLPAKQGLKGTNLDFSDVDPSLYDGGLQDMDPGPGTDVAQDLRLTENGGRLDLQWDDPVDVDGATYGASIFSATGAITATNPAPTFNFTPTAAQRGKIVEFRTDAIPSGTTDLVLSVDAPDGTNLGEVDTDTSPEVLVARLSQAGTYKITVTGFEGETGDITVGVRPVLSPSKVTTDFNALLFDEDGNFLTSVSDLNTASGLPYEIADLVGLPEIQLVISRSGTGPVGATRLRNVLFGEMNFTEYFDPLAPATFGHSVAAGATGVGAYDPFRSYLPEPYTSPGGDLPIFFDSAGNRFSKPQIRRTPQISSTDRVNNTFFVLDDARDPDTLPNFGGTSAAAPHAAAIAALVLQKAGGGKALSPTALRKRLRESTYDHDLDPMISGGSTNGLTVTARGYQGRELVENVPGSMNDAKFFRVSYSGKVPLKSLTFFGETASPTALGKRNPPKSDGIVFDRRPFLDTAPFGDQGFPFTIGSASGGLSKSSVTPTYSVPGGGESKAGQFRRLKVNFASGLKSGQGLQFGVDRDLAVSGFGGSNEGNGADELGGAVFMPQGTTAPDGMVFVGQLTNNKLIYGMFSNRLGHGWTPVDGYGVVNAEKAVGR